MALNKNSQLLRYLERHARGQIDALRRDHPHDYALLHAVGVFGQGADPAARSPAPPASEAGHEPDAWPAMIGLVKAYAAAASADLASKLDGVERRMRLGQNTKFAGGLMATVGGAVVALMPALTDDKPSVASAAAVLSCIGGCITLAAGRLERTSDGLRLTASDYQMLVNHRAELAAIRRRTEVVALIPLAGDELVKLYNRTVQIADELARLMQ